MGILNHWKIILTAGAAGLALCALALFFHAGTGDFLSESGPVEMLSAVLHLCSAIGILFLRPLWAWLHLSVVCLLMAEREFEAEVLESGAALRLFSEWLDAHVLHNVWVLAPLYLWVLGSLVLLSLPRWWSGLKAGSLVPPLVFLACAFAGLAEVASEGAKMLSAGLTEATHHQLEAFEETGELCFSVGIFAAVLIGLAADRFGYRTHDLPDPTDTRRDQAADERAA